MRSDWLIFMKKKWMVQADVIVSEISTFQREKCLLRLYGSTALQLYGSTLIPTPGNELQDMLGSLVGKHC